MLVERPARRTVGSQRFPRTLGFRSEGLFASIRIPIDFALIRVEQRLAIFCNGEAGCQAGAFDAVKRDETRDAVLR